MKLLIINMTQLAIKQIKNLEDILDSLHCKTWTSGSSYEQNTLVVYYRGTINTELYRVVSANYVANDIDTDLVNNYIERISSFKELYLNMTPTPIEVGGVPEGFTFNNLTVQEVFDTLFYPELFPTLVAPSHQFSCSLTETLQEVGLVIPIIDFFATFNRGEITPPYGTSGFRSGLPNTYNYTGTGLPASVPSTALSDTQTILNYEIIYGIQTWECSVSYDEGEQPLSSKGNNYDVPFPAGTTGNISVTLEGVYPVFATTENITYTTKQPLISNSAQSVTVAMVAESGGNKQIIEIATSFPAVTGIQFFNTFSGTWEWLGGSQANSLTHFTQSTTVKTINGHAVNYNVYTHNQFPVGSRQLRFFFV